MKEPFLTKLREKKEITKDIMGVISLQMIETIEKPKSIFGACLDQLMSVAPNLNVPFILSRLCGYIEKYGLEEESLFQVKEKDQVVDDLKKQFDEYGDAPLESKGDISAAAKLLTIFLEELPEPLIPVTVCSTSEGFTIDSVEFLQYLRSLVDKLPIHTFSSLKYLCHFLTLVTMHADVNGMNCADIGLIFGPLIFRAGPENSAVHCSFAKNATCTFVSDYYSIFEDKEFLYGSIDSRECVLKDVRQVGPFPSSVAPLINLKPLNVMIPHIDVTLKGEIISNYNKRVPTLLIEKHLKTIKAGTSSAQENVMKSGSVMSIFSTRKRKDVILAESQALVQDRDTATLHTELIESLKVKNYERNQLSQQSSSGRKILAEKDLAASNELFNLLPRQVCFESDSSPHPPNPKRRELEISDFQHNSSEDDASRMESVELQWIDDNEEPLQRDDCGTSCSGEMYEIDISSSFPRSASCPTSVNEDAEDADSDNVFSLSWNKLFDSVEPVRAQHRFSWPVLNMAHDDNDVIPAVSNQHKLYEAPLSPSAFKPYLSHRSGNIDPYLPPSPPEEQENFDLSIKDDSHTDCLKVLSKNIHSLQKKLKRFDKKFEKEHGFKPTYAEKIVFPENKKLIEEMNKQKQKLKVLKDDLQSSASSTQDCQDWCLTSKVHVLEDTTNCLESKEVKDFNLKSKPTMETLWDEALKSLEDDRKLSNRPECLEHMTKEQVEDEKLAIQKALLQFESIHGKPKDHADRNKIRPLYERYRNIKHLVRSSSFPSNCINTSNSLQPIMEHEAMDFTVKQNDVSQCSDIDESPDYDHTKKSSNSGSQSQASLHNKYNNSNLHELPVTALVSEHHHARHEKRRLRKLLREFEADFLRANGRKVQKEDKAPVEDYYVEYKFIKARIKLLEALMSKHGMHSSS